MPGHDVQPDGYCNTCQTMPCIKQSAEPYGVERIKAAFASVGVDGARYLPESTIVDMLIRRYTVVDTTRPSRPHRYALADHVPIKPFGGHRICDFMALDCQLDHPLHGFEIKASRADWLAELRDPAKAESFKRHCSYWWLVVSDQRLVQEGELPADWGLLVVAGDRLRQVKPAPKLQAESMPWPMVVAFTRAVARTARRAQAVPS